MDWKDDAERIKSQHPDYGRTRLFRELIARGHTMGITSVQRWLKRWAGGTLDEKDLQRDKRDIERLQRRVKDQQQQLAEESALADIWAGLKEQNITPPKWTTPKRSSAGQAVVTAALADTHFDEVVNPAEVENLNAYNRHIAELRIKKYFSSLVQLGRDYVGNVDLNGLVLMLLGDMVSGTIHEELAETNEAHIIPSCLHWVEQLAAGITLLAGQYGRVHVAGVVGNHGRQSRKPRTKGRVEDNFDFLIYALLAKHFAGVSEITVQVPTAADLDLQIYDQRYRLTHGDQFRGGSGIAGALSPMMIGHSRKSRNAAAARRPFDHLVMGHWHQHYDFKRIIACGSVKGIDEYGYTNNFEFEEPSGAFWLTDSKKGRTIRAPIHVRDKNEKWDRSHPKKDTGPDWLAA